LAELLSSSCIDLANCVSFVEYVFKYISHKFLPLQGCIVR
jgi:hypothetical protein